ncbi:hypothetical protein K438DRAFT_1747104 [Mycena galopus ATCC 62051]|nr:hypothetical protein K438DRAFT_1747104 [Mycena galopus ATCC 62051]
MEFPQELVEEILDRLDSESLKLCSLVCWAWVFRTRSRLFRKCTIHPKTVLTVRDLLQSPNCTFLQHIRSLDVERHSRRHTDPVFNEIAAAHFVGIGIRELDLSLCFNGDYAIDCTGFLAAFPHVTRLRLMVEVWRLEVQLPLMAMISLFPALQELSIDWLEDGSVSSSPPSVMPPPGLRSVRLQGPSIAPILSWLHHSNHLPKIESVTLSHLNHSNVDILFELDLTEFSIVRGALQQLGGALRHFNIDLYRAHPEYRAYAPRFLCPSEPPTADPFAAFDLALHPNLETLTIHDDTGRDRDPKALLRFIKSLAAPNLERLALHLNFRCDNSDWAALDAFLAPARFPSLHSVTFTCHMLWQHEEPHEFLHTKLPLLVASGVIVSLNRVPAR